jgi:hypothetical protein
MPRYRIILGLIAAVLLGGVALSWPAMQDDALIHLRYAAYLCDALQRHQPLLITYDGLTPSYGASSLLYIALLAALRGITHSPVLPRIVSSAAHLVLFAALARMLLRLPTRHQRLLGLALLASLAMPSAVRWLDDGMETSLVLLLTAMLAAAVLRAAKPGTAAWTSTVLLTVLAFLSVLLRVELLLLTATVALMLLFTRRSLRSLTPLVGGLLAAGLIFRVTGSLLPDAAVAKAFGLHAWLGTLSMTASSVLSAPGLALGSLAVWILSLLTVLRVRRLTAADILANGLFPLTVILATLRGQTIPGIRYYEWTILFPILWNLHQDVAGDVETSRRAGRASLAPSRLVTALLLALLILLPVEAHYFLHLFHERNAVLARMRSQPLAQLADIRLTAFDVGFIGYFTQAPLCDTAGLVNGRAAARATYQERLARCADFHPDIAFFNEAQMDDFNAHLDLRDWSLCGVYDFANLRDTDRHYLVASPATAVRVCRVTSEPPRPLRPLLPR